jgi:hypothetical protein
MMMGVMRLPRRGTSRIGKQGEPCETGRRTTTPAISKSAAVVPADLIRGASPPELYMTEVASSPRHDVCSVNKGRLAQLW